MRGFCSIPIFLITSIFLVYPSLAFGNDDDLTKLIDITHHDLSHRIFRRKTLLRPTVHVISRPLFRVQFPIPWAGAIFFQNVIYIPTDTTDLRSALRHEYVHALVDQYSRGKCPAWLDEGLAQLHETTKRNDNRLYQYAIAQWIKDYDKLLPLADLASGFGHMTTREATVAYAQSLLAAKYLTRRHGYDRIMQYFDLLAADVSHDDAFRKAFRDDFVVFEQRLNKEALRLPIR